MKLNDLKARRFLKISKYRRTRIKQLKKLLVQLGTYQEYIKGTKHHKDRVMIIEGFLDCETKKKRKALQSNLETMMTEEFPIVTDDNFSRDFLELKAAMLYNYLHRNEVSHL